MTADPHTNPAALHAGTPAGADASPASAGIYCTACDAPRRPNCCNVARMKIPPFGEPRNCAEETALARWNMENEQ